MKILYFSSGKGDYLEVQLLHGLRQLYGSYVVDYPRMDCAYRGYDLSQAHGKGFGSFGNLPDISIDREQIHRKVVDRYYDLVIYGAGFLNRAGGYKALPMLNLTSKAYNKQNLFVFDGDDGTQILHNLAESMTYFKRELREDSPHIHPVGFSFPHEKAFTEPVEKTQWFAQSKPKATLEEIKKVDPDQFPNPIRSFNYIADREYELYNDYRESWFGITMKKAGWDCQRHYEILFNLCMPYFWDIEQCPPRTMTRWPKGLLKAVLNLPGVSYGEVDQKTFLDKGFSSYYDLLNELWFHMFEHLTTVKMAEYILNYAE